MPMTKVWHHLRSILLVYIVALPAAQIAFWILQFAFASRSLDGNVLGTIWVGLVWGHGPYFLIYGPLYAVAHSLVWERMRPGSKSVALSIVLASSLGLIGTAAHAAVGGYAWVLFGPMFTFGMAVFGLAVGILSQKRNPV